jgi:hypothetical protein
VEKFTKEMTGSILLIVGNIVAFISAVHFYAKGQNKAFADRESWTNKYKQPLEPAKRNWYTKLVGIKYKEKFPLSGSILVALTDDYHRWQFYYKVLLCVSIITYRPIFFFDVAIYFLLWGIVFTLTFKDEHH